ncbi:MAG: phospholipase [Candidatus Altiarchaeales archaeon]|nr:phospholipase [Candidatus Altiarchaeales archaeon]
MFLLFMKLWQKLILVFILGLLFGLVLQSFAFQKSCPTPACVDSERVIPVSDRGYYPRAHEILTGAEESIHIVTFELKYYEKYPDSKMNTLVEDLVAAHRRGVDVKVVVDEYSDRNNAYHILDEAGIPWRFDGNKTTTHAKLIIVDGEIVLLGSTNLSYYGLERNHEANLYVEDPLTAKYYENYFQKLWSS